VVTDSRCYGPDCIPADGISSQEKRYQSLTPRPSRLLFPAHVPPVINLAFHLSLNTRLPSKHTARSYWTPTRMAPPPPAVLTTLLVLALFAAYLTTGSLVTDRISPSIFFTLAICLAAGTFHPTILVSAAGVAASITAQCFLSIDHIVSLFG
jgi:hypothetical protein